jgi:hypothetical protein
MSGAKILGALAIAATCLGAANAQAGQAGWSKTALLDSVEPTSQRRYQFTLQLDEAHGCKSKNTYYQDYTANGAQFIYETLLTALAHELPVQVLTTGRCELNGYAEVSSVRIAR